MVAVYKFRTELCLTQAQLAAIVGVVPSTITQYETGVRNPNVVMLKKLSKALHTTADALLEPINIEEANQNGE